MKPPCMNIDVTKVNHVKGANGASATRAGTTPKSKTACWSAFSPPVPNTNICQPNTTMLVTSSRTVTSGKRWVGMRSRMGNMVATPWLSSFAAGCDQYRFSQMFWRHPR